MRFNSSFVQRLKDLIVFADLPSTKCTPLVHTFITFLLWITPVECLFKSSVQSLISWTAWKPAWPFSMTTATTACHNIFPRCLPPVATAAAGNQLRKNILIIPGSLSCVSGYVRQQAKIETCYLGVSSPLTSYLLLPSFSFPLLSSVPSVSIRLLASLTIAESEYIAQSITGIFSFCSENFILCPIMFVIVTEDYSHI